MVCTAAIWLAANPIDMRAGAERLVARVMNPRHSSGAHGYIREHKIVSAGIGRRHRKLHTDFVDNVVERRENGRPLW